MRINPSKIIECACYLKRVNHGVVFRKQKELKIFGIILLNAKEHLEWRGFPSIKVTHTYHEAGICYYEPHVEIITDAGLRTVWFQDEGSCIDYYNEISKNFLELKQ